MKDFYYILGTDSRCTPDELDTAYRKLAQKLAPSSDEQDNFLQSHFREISEAYEILSDPIKRRRYDDAVKKTHKRQLANFKSKNLSVATVGALILFTALFGFYVLRSINNNGKVAPAVAVAETPVVSAPAKVKHHKKRHHIKANVAKASPANLVKKDTVRQIAAAKPIIITASKNINTPIKPAPLVKVTAASITVPITQTAKNSIAPANIVAKASVVKPAAVVAPPPPVVARTYAPVDSSYATYLKPMSEQIYLHQQADYMSAVVSVLPNNSKIRVLAKGQTFYKIAYNNQVGYVPKWTVVKP